VERARAQWPRAKLPDPQVSFDLRGLTAGEACASDWLIRYNDELLQKHGEEFLAEIVPHEVAHLVVVGRFRRRRCRPHGPEWKEVMAFFGLPPRRCHRFEATPARRVRRISYRCSCPSPHLLTKRAHLRIRRGTAEYSCRRCGDVLVRVEG
jgi:SprT protein